MTTPQTKAEKEAAINAMAQAIPQMKAGDQTFAGSMLSQFGKKGDLSPKQWPWVLKLTERVTAPAPAPQAVELGDFKGVFDLVEKAKAKIKRPKIHLQTKGGAPVLLKQAGSKSRNAGMLYVTDGGGFYDGTYYGKISADGAVEISRKAEGSSELDDVLDVLRELQANPAEVATRHGRLTGHCCFCGLHLGGEGLSKTGEKSKAAGFGETCAKNFGLHAEWKSAVQKFGTLEAQVANTDDDISEHDGEQVQNVA